MTDESCKRCIHRKMCSARDNYDSVSKSWNENYPYAKMNTDGDILATICTEFQTLSDIHVIKKDDKEEAQSKKTGMFSR